MDKGRLNTGLSNRSRLAIVLVGTVLLVLAIVSEHFIQTEFQLRRRIDKEKQTTLELGAIRTRLEGALYSNLLILNGVASYISLRPGLTDREFRLLAEQSLQYGSILGNVVAAPDFIISYVYPLEGNEQVLGVNYRDLGPQWEEALRAKEERRMIVAGPVDLIQGGRALIGRTPVFEAESGDFWGLVSSVIHMDALMDEALATGDFQSIHIAIRGKDGKGAEGEVIFGDPAIFDPEREAVSMSVSLPNGSWVLAGEPMDGWSVLGQETILLRAAVAVIFLLIFVLFAYRINKQAHLISIQKLLMQAQTIGRIGAFAWHPESDLISWSQECYRIAGMKEDGLPLTLRTLLYSIHPDDRPQVEHLFRGMDGAGSRTLDQEFRINTAEGNTNWVHMLAEAKQGGGRKALVRGTIQDVTQRKRVELELAKARQHIYNILEKTTDAFFEVDTHFNLTHMNERAIQNFGLKGEGLQGVKLWSVLPELRRSEFHQELQIAREQGVVRKFETFFKPRSIWLEVYVYPTTDSLSVYCNDITERRRLQMERDNILKLSLDMICIAGFDGRFIELNPAWERTLGWPAEEMKSRPWLSFVHQDDVQRTIDQGDVLFRGEPVINFENRYICKDGSYRWLAWNSFPDLTEQRIYAVVRDVTRRKEQEEALARSEAQFRRLVEGAPLGLALTTHDGKIEYLNPGCVRLLGYYESEVDNLDELLSSTCGFDPECSDTREDWASIRDSAHQSGKELSPVEYMVRTKSGAVKYVEFRYMPLERKGVALFTDITERKNLESELTRLATTDPLTGVLNRRRFMESGQAEMARAIRYSRSLAVCMLDIDHFKRINDTYGHQAGDEVLMRMSAECDLSLRENDLFGRMGGEEFAMLLPEVEQEQAIEVAERVRKSLENLEVHAGGERIHFTVSIGVAVAAKDEDDLERVLSRADKALYEAKEGGRNQVRMG